MAVLLFWLAAAVLVGAAHILLDPLSVSAGTVATLAALLGAAYGYMRFGARNRGVSQALGAGIVWLTLAIVTELLVTMRAGHGWYALLGDPARPLLRNIFLFAWVFAPALFAHVRS